MLIWLASYPRSGNTLIRTLIHQTFGIRTYSIYDESRAGELNRLRGGKHFDGDLDKFLRHARASSELFVVKTHDATPPADRSIYVVRDARAAFISYRRFIKSFHGLDVLLEDLITGKQWPGNWSIHVTEMLDRPPATVLVLKYEDLAARPQSLVPILTKFLGIEPTGAFTMTFAEIHRIAPDVAPVGSNLPGIEIVEREYRELFWTKHGGVMRRLGYA